MMIIIILMILIGLRMLLSVKSGEYQEDLNWGYEQFVGDQEIQADCGKVVRTPAGFCGILADGIGKENFGRISSHVAVESVAELYKDYQIISKPNYFFKRSFYYANTQIQRALEDRSGGVSLASTLIINGVLYYVQAGNIRIALCRKGILMPLNEGHTLNKLAESAYFQGKIEKQDALDALKESRLWNYLGQDGFKEIEIYDVPIQLKEKDRILIMTKGIYEAVPFVDIEDILSKNMTAKKQSLMIINKFIELENVEKDNGSVIVIEINRIPKKY